VEIPQNTWDLPDRMKHFRPANFKPSPLLSCAFCLQNPSLKPPSGPGLLLQTRAEPSNGSATKEHPKSRTQQHHLQNDLAVGINPSISETTWPRQALSAWLGAVFTCNEASRTTEILQSWSTGRGNGPNPSPAIINETSGAGLSV